MSKKRTTKRKKAEKNKDWPAVVYFWIMGLALASYVITRMALDGYPHYYHWLSGLAGGLAGVPIGWLWYRWRGDVF